MLAEILTPPEYPAASDTTAWRTGGNRSPPTPSRLLLSPIERLLPDWRCVTGGAFRPW